MSTRSEDGWWVSFRLALRLSGILRGFRAESSRIEMVRNKEQPFSYAPFRIMVILFGAISVAMGREALSQGYVWHTAIMHGLVRRPQGAHSHGLSSAVCSFLPEFFLGNGLLTAANADLEQYSFCRSMGFRKLADHRNALCQIGRSFGAVYRAPRGLNGLKLAGASWKGPPLPLGFSQVLILKELKVVCFHTLLQVLILKVFALQQELCGCDRLKAIQEWRFRVIKAKTPAGSWRYGYGHKFTQ